MNVDPRQFDKDEIGDWAALAAQLYSALKNTKPCHCTEPTWWDKEKRAAHKCSGCVAVDSYEQATGIARV